MSFSTVDEAGVPAEEWTDAQLVARTQAGDIQAFGTLYERRWSIVYQAAKRVTRSHDDALDVTSSVFADVLEKAQAGRLKPDRPSLAGYLSTAGKNAALDLVQRARTLQTTDNSEFPESDHGPSDTPELAYGPSEMLALFRAFLSLDGKDQDAIEARVVRRTPPRDLAKATGVSANTISQQVTRAMSRLSAQYLRQRAAVGMPSAACGWSEALLSSVLGDLPAAQDTLVKDHAALCLTCSGLEVELKELPIRLRVVGLPLLASLREARFRLVLAGAVSPPTQPSTERSKLPPPPVAPQGTADSHDTAEGSGPTPHSSRRPMKVLAVLAMLLLSLGGIAALNLPDTDRRDVADDLAASGAAPPSTSEVVTPTVPQPPPTSLPGGFGARSVATARSNAVPVYDSPTATRPSFTLPNPSEVGLPQVFPVKTDQGPWLEVLLPTPPNSSTGWIRLADVTVVPNDFFIRIELGARRLTVWRGAAVVLQESVIVGRAADPTPLGLHYILTFVQSPQNDLRCPQSAIQAAFVLSARTNANPPCFIILLLSSDDPALRTETRGSVRMSNQGLLKLADMLPTGTPIEVVP